MSFPSATHVQNTVLVPIPYAVYIVFLFPLPVLHCFANSLCQYYIVFPIPFASFPLFWKFHLHCFFFPFASFTLFCQFPEWALLCFANSFREIYMVCPIPVLHCFGNSLCEFYTFATCLGTTTGLQPVVSGHGSDFKPVQSNQAITHLGAQLNNLIRVKWIAAGI